MAAAAATSRQYVDFMAVCILQCLVPLWDALNHVTGEANVRLAHDSERGRLLMIATQNIVAGEEIINDYGPLSNGELLRRCCTPLPTHEGHTCGCAVHATLPDACALALRGPRGVASLLVRHQWTSAWDTHL